MSKKSSDAGIFLWMTYQTMQNMGLDAASIFASVNLPNQPPDKNIRRDNSTQNRFWTAAEKISNDTDIGLHVGHQMPAFRGLVIEYLFLSSPTFGDGLKRALKYQALLTDVFKLSLTVEEDKAILSGFEHPVRHYLEAAIGIFINFFKYITHNNFKPTEIHLTYTKGASTENYEKTWKCPVILGKPTGAIIFPTALLKQSSPAAEPELLKVHENIAEQQLANLEKHQLIYTIERLLSNGLLESGKFDQKYIAEQLNRNPRSLRADLQALNTNYEQILNHYREKLARKLLAHTQESIDQIVYLTGFSEPSAFTRAFKRWTGETPSAYRQRKQNKLEN
ncbi:AraC family transcriptional regulator [Acinetobacter nosocomialis]|uniref:AraC family transcriptional regulator n=1 Tax=Acinetobacter nosocomialis TaxID=106654 RepID=UPI0003B2A4BB|nr:AraC family transcriptional regulator [Acinetobacter nosocomialis]MBO8207854.1 AraC family transcriptional regulator [Acinetobacter nosocomialis]MBO8224305.1 AraC family transcriptional regulator [Acinetobacter nosocomialis]MBO8250386.1 AraC family transcriptional regulator [Acinetobacter nosocomialis]MDH2633360.1 AraC family transcriptional regulator [Acinetobacter nosocomialis]OTT93298.1 AraC family transcriptional regulator [Acinetobacter nosocomialis]